MIKIGLLGNCHYTNVALNHMLKEIYKYRDGIEITVLSKLDLENLRKSESLDFLIVTGYSHTSFHCLLKFLLGKFYHKSLRLIVLTEPQITPLMTHFLTEYSHRTTFIRLNESYVTIKQHLESTLLSDVEPNAEYISIRRILTRREFFIMKALYSGIQVRDLCNKLTISEKTVSSHKLSARDKLQYSRQVLLNYTMLMDALQGKTKKQKSVERIIFSIVQKTNSRTKLQIN
ncbi:LuxR C-terminal-related transcriptional regulator [Yersinia frederiksenii]|uniref:LuxR C-terminal-related transcriptional regulator n=1 Tax=Yersinia frederiksenii TaxID=29484 RepID=UPI0005E6EF4E|nr:LuxR C-terminal-related transcriptional regulator [Yersinia frederiksenii]CQI92503.1 two component system sensor kinase SsrB [Yersinia frederiksenii]